MTESKIFEKFCKQAQGNKKQKYVLIIDEINRAPLASVLGELIYGLEYRESSIATPYAINGKQEFSIPDNLYIIGTMNTADRSIGSIDYAVRRRFAFVQVKSNGEEIEGSWIDKNVGIKAKKLYDKLMNEEDGIFSKEYLEDQDMDVNDIKIGHTYFLGRKNEAVEDEKGYLEYRIEYQIKPIYEEYIKDGIIKRDGLKKFDEILKKLELKRSAQKNE
ncbi:MAG: AAA family ATPase [Anaerobutyricum sp.]